MEARADGGFRDGGDGGGGGTGEEIRLKRKFIGDGGGEGLIGGVGGGFSGCSSATPRNEGPTSEFLAIDDPVTMIEGIVATSSSKSSIDPAKPKKIGGFLHFSSSRSKDDFITMDEYVENMKPDQKDIYYIAANSINSARNRPILDKLAETDIEVLFLDPIQEGAILITKSFQGKNFVDVGYKVDEHREIKQEFGGTCDWIKKCLGERVDIVQVSNHLKASPCIITDGADFFSLRTGQSDAPSLHPWSVFEINPEHPLIIYLHNACKSNPTDKVALCVIDLLYETALNSNPESLD